MSFGSVVVRSGAVVIGGQLDWRVSICFDRRSRLFELFRFCFHVLSPPPWCPWAPVPALSDVTRLCARACVESLLARNLRSVVAINIVCVDVGGLLSGV